MPPFHADFTRDAARAAATQAASTRKAPTLARAAAPSLVVGVKIRLDALRCEKKAHEATVSEHTATQLAALYPEWRQHCDAHACGEAPAPAADVPDQGASVARWTGAVQAAPLAEGDRVADDERSRRSKDIAILARKVYELSALTRPRRLDDRKWEALLILNAVYSAATPDGVAEANAVRKARFGDAIRKEGLLSAPHPNWHLGRDNGKPPVTPLALESALDNPHRDLRTRCSSSRPPTGSRSPTTRVRWCPRCSTAPEATYAMSTSTACATARRHGSGSPSSSCSRTRSSRPPCSSGSTTRAPPTTAASTTNPGLSLRTWAERSRVNDVQNT